MGRGAVAAQGTILLHSPTVPLARLRAGDGRAWDELEAGGGETLAGEDGDRGKSQEGTCRGPTAAAAATVTTFVRLLFRALSRPRQDKDRRLEPRGVVRSDRAVAGGPRPAHNTRTGSGGQQKTCTGCSEHSKF